MVAVPPDTVAELVPVIAAPVGPLSIDRATFPLKAESSAFKFVSTLTAIVKPVPAVTAVDGWVVMARCGKATSMGFDGGDVMPLLVATRVKVLPLLLITRLPNDTAPPDAATVSVPPRSLGSEMPLESSPAVTFWA